MDGTQIISSVLLKNSDGIWKKKKVRDRKKQVQNVMGDHGAALHFHFAESTNMD